MTGQGWECPRCGEVYGPSVKKCDNVDCKKTPRAQPAARDFGDVGDAIDGDDLHDMLYRPSVNQFPDGAGKKKRRGGGGGGGGGGSSDGSTGLY